MLLAVPGLCFFFFMACATVPPLATTTEYEKTVDTGKPAAQSFGLTGQWIGHFFNAPKPLLKNSDRASGHFEGPVWIVLDKSALVEHTIRYNLDIGVKDGSTQFRFQALYLIKTTYEMRDTLPFRDEPIATPVKLPIDQVSFDAFTQEMDKLVQHYQDFMSSQQS